MQKDREPGAKSCVNVGGLFCCGRGQLELCGEMLEPVPRAI